MIARIWHGWTSLEKADAYESFLRDALLPTLGERVPGLRGAYLLRRGTGGEQEFAVVTLFDSLDAVRAFAGDDYEVPVIEPEAQRLLIRGDERAVHYEVVLRR